VRPLEDIRVVAVEQYGAGPFGSLYLADLGAEIIKIEDPRTGGDVSRYVPPFQDGEDSLFFETFNRGKKSIDLDLSEPAGRSVLLDLIRASDALYSNLRGDIPERLGIRYDDLKETNPRIVCCSLSGFGMTGPRHAEPAYDYILQGLTGWMSLTGEPDDPPMKTGLSLVDYSGGFVAALSLVAGVHAARRDGKGMDCDLSLFDVGLSLLAYLATWHLNGGYMPARTAHSAHPSLVPFQNFETADGWIVVGCAKEKFWQRLTEVVGRPDLGSDDRFRDFAARRAHADQLLPLLTSIFRTASSAHWLAKLSEAGIPSGPIRGVEEAIAEPHAAARGMFIETEHERFGTVKHIATAARVGERPTHYRRAPRRNENAREILEGLLRYDDERIASLRAQGAFGHVSAMEPA
jgi:crotonobetainyl-CoA:carnitine CoA-transferase CaiB-like acyl-CoA transferase